jgi:uncharacterized protein YihD (DUF1040 family)
MKPFFLSIITGLWVLSVQAQSRQEPLNLQQARTVLLPQMDASPTLQVANWGMEAQQNPKNANAWLNYAIWTQRNNALTPGQKQQQLQQIGAEASPYIGSSGEWQFIQFLQSNKTDSNAILRALEKMTDKTLVYPFAIQSAIIRNNIPDLKTHCESFSQLMPFDATSAFYRYHANVLQSAPDSAIVFAMGENDLVPMAMLQQVNGLRTDVQLKYYDPVLVKQYPNVYLCLSLGEQVLKKYEQAASFRGLLLGISGKNEAGVPENILPKKVDLGYLQKEHFDNQQAQLHNNYLPALLFLYRYYQQKDAGNAAYHKQLIEKIAREGGREKLMAAALEQ